MFVYILIYTLIVLFSFFIRRNPLLKFIFLSFIILFIGLRYEVGCDWFNYLNIFEENYQFSDLFSRHTDIFYSFLNIIAHKLSANIALVNTLVAIITVLGLFFFIKNKKNFPYLLVYSIPYFLFIVSMGYTRQALAIGFIFWGLAFFEKRRYFLFFVSYILAVLSHKTAIIILILQVAFINYWFLLFALLIAYIIFVIYKNWFIFAFQAYVLNQTISSKGFFLRFVEYSTIILPFLFLAIKRKNYPYMQGIKPFIILYLLIPLIYLVLHSTTVADRFMLYTYPLQLYALDYLLSSFKKEETFLIKLGIIVLGYINLFIFFTKAIHKDCWLPYDNFIFHWLGN